MPGGRFAPPAPPGSIMSLENDIVLLPQLAIRTMRLSQGHTSTQGLQYGERPAFTTLLDLHFLVMGGGTIRTEADYRRLFTAAGFELTRALPTQSVLGESILEGLRA